MEGRAHPRYCEGNSDHTVLGGESLYEPYYPHLAALRREFERCLFFYFEPRERMRTPTAVREVRHIGAMGEELASFLNTLRARDPKQFDAVKKALHAIIPAITDIEVQVNKIGEAELLLKEGDVSMSARLVSEGTLRALGLVALAGAQNVDKPSLIGFEEPENGIHPRRIADIARVLENMTRSNSTQIIVTTHSPYFLDIIPFEYLFVCYRDKKVTHIIPFPQWSTLGDLGRGPAIREALDDETPISERVIRGDFDVA